MFTIVIILLYYLMIQSEFLYHQKESIYCLLCSSGYPFTRSFWSFTFYIFHILSKGVQFGLSSLTLFVSCLFSCGCCQYAPLWGTWWFQHSSIISNCINESANCNCHWNLYPCFKASSYLIHHLIHSNHNLSCHDQMINKDN